MKTSKFFTTKYKQYGNAEAEPAKSEHAVFVVERTAKGALAVAFRGIQNGEFHQVENIDLGLVLDHGTNQEQVVVGARVIGDATLKGLLEVHNPDEYLAKIAEPELRRDKLVHVLEDPTEGIYTLLGPAEYNDYDVFGTMTVVDPDTVTCFWGSSPVDYSETGSHVPMKIEHRGFHHFAVPLTKGHYPFHVNSFKQRLASYPILVGHSPLTDEAVLAAFYARDAFEAGVVERGEPSAYEAVLYHMTQLR